MESPCSTASSLPRRVDECVSILSNSSISGLEDDVISPVVVANNPEAEESAPPDCEGMPFFEPGDGDMHISVNGTRFETHRYLIKRFQGLRLLLEENPRGISIQRDDISVEDFRETFRILYTSSHTLLSALRVATIYEYYALRHYCIQCLETLDSELDAIKRILIARELRLPAWEEQAHRELATRDAPITGAEAAIIGMDAFVRIAEVREKEQRRRGKEVDAVGGAKDVQDNTMSDRTRKGSPYAAPPCPRLESYYNTPESTTPPEIACQTESDSTTENVMGPLFSGVELGGTYKWGPAYGYGIEAPGCECHFINNDQEDKRRCAMVPCTISAFQHIQAQQLAHARRISSLESSIKRLSSSVTSEPTPAAPKAQYSTLKSAPEPSSG
ncbi:hypothetical protein FRC11_003556, partial [Ceratobasidium sp. 423]